MSESTPPSPTARGKHGRLFIALAVLAVCLFIGVGLWLAYRPQPDQLQGMVDAEHITVATKVPMSRVEQLLVRRGDRVKEGQPLVVLRSPELDARLDQAVGALAGAEAAQARALAGTRREDIETLRATAASTDAALALAERTYARMHTLHSEGVVSTQRMDEARAARDAARGQSRAAHEQVLRAERGTRPEDKDVAAASVQVAKAGVEAVEVLRHETTLDSPIHGEIAHTLVQPGELVAAGVPVLSVIEIGRPWVSVNVRENQLHGLAVGRELVGRLPALDGRSLRFTVQNISAQGEFATWRATRQSSGYDVRSFEVRLHPVEPVQALRPGMSVLFDWPQS